MLHVSMVYVVEHLLELTVQCMHCFYDICRMCLSFEQNCEKEVTPEDILSLQILNIDIS